MTQREDAIGALLDEPDQVPAAVDVFGRGLERLKLSPDVVVRKRASYDAVEELKFYKRQEEPDQ